MSRIASTSAFPVPVVFNAIAGPYSSGEVRRGDDYADVEGINVLEFFAGCAMASFPIGEITDFEGAARTCFDYAEAMCAEADRRRKGQS